MEWQFKPLPKGKMTVVSSHIDPMWRKCEDLEFQVFSACRYIDPGGRRRLDDFDGYKRCLFIAAQDAAAQISGIIRLVFNPARSMNKGAFPTLNHARILPPGRQFPEDKAADGKTLFLHRKRYEWVMGLGARKIMDFATMAIDPRSRDAATSVALLSRAVFKGFERSVRYGMAAIDTPFYEKLRHRGLPFEAIGPSVHYWGSSTTPCIMDMYRVPTGIRKLIIPLMRVRGILGGDK